MYQGVCYTFRKPHRLQRYLQALPALRSRDGCSVHVFVQRFGNMRCAGHTRLTSLSVTRASAQLEVPADCAHLLACLSFPRGPLHLLHSSSYLAGLPPGLSACHLCLPSALCRASGSGLSGPDADSEPTPNPLSSTGQQMTEPRRNVLWCDGSSCDWG